MIKLKKVKRTFSLTSGDIEAVKSTNLNIKKGSFVIVSGRSGAGKTTLLNMISGIDDPSGGDVSIDGKLLEKLSKKQLNSLEFQFCFC